MGSEGTILIRHAGVLNLRVPSEDRSDRYRRVVWGGSRSHKSDLGLGDDPPVTGSSGERTLTEDWKQGGWGDGLYGREGMRRVYRSKKGRKF